MNIRPNLSSNTPQRVDNEDQLELLRIGNSSAVESSQVPASRVQGRENLREASGTSRVRAVEARETVGVTREQLRLWAKEGRISSYQPNPGNESAAKKFRTIIADKILERNNQTSQNANKALILDGIDLPSALREIADITRFFDPKRFQRSSTLTLNSIGSSYTQTLVQIAADNGKAAAIAVLKAAGADMNQPNKYGLTPAHIAARKGNAAAIAALKAAGADMNQPDKIYGWTPVHNAADEGKAAAIAALKAAGADVNQPDNHGLTPVIIAARKGNADAITILKASGADMNQPDKSGLTPVHVAAALDKTAAIAALKAAGADMNQPNKHGLTPAHIAARKGNAAAIAALKAAGADMNQPDKDGTTPIDIAREKYHAEIVRLLSEANTHPSTQNNQDEQPLIVFDDLIIFDEMLPTETPQPITHTSENLLSQDALQVINDQKPLTLPELKTWRGKTQNAKNALQAIQAIRMAISNGYIENNHEVQNEVSAILTAAQRNVVQNIKEPQAQEEQLRLIEHMARLCLGESIGLISNAQYETLASLIDHTIKIEHLHEKVHETQDQIKHMSTQFQNHVSNVQELAQAFQENLNALKTNQQDIADKIIEMGKRMRSVRLTASLVNAVQTVANFIPFIGPAISSLGELAQNVSAAARAHNVLVGLHELKAALGSAATAQPEIQGVTMGQLLPETQNTAFGQLKLSTVLDSVHEQYIYHQIGQLEQELRKPLPEAVHVPASPQLTANAAPMPGQQNQAAGSSSDASSSYPSSEAIIPDADPQLAVTHEDIQAHQSTPVDDAASVASSGMKTEDEYDYQNILMSAVKRNADRETFSSLIQDPDFGKYLNRTITNKKGTESTAVDFAIHYGRLDQAKQLMKEKAQSAQGKIIPAMVYRATNKNKDKYNHIQSAQDYDSASDVSSGFRTDDEYEDENTLMSAVKHNFDLETFSSLIDDPDYQEHLNRIVTNKKGANASASDFARHYGRPELAKQLIMANARSAQNKLPFDIYQTARKNQALYDDEGQRQS